MEENNLPIEVKLVDSVRKCRCCKWFWGEELPYGDFPLYDWNEDFPEKIRTQRQTTKNITEPLLVGKACGQGQIDPGIMHGCRKAPIMTIGINPNMTAYFPGPAGTRWAYPKFSGNARYAYYYRHHNVYQESLDLEFVKHNIVEGTAITAEKNGWLLAVKRSADHRWALLTILYDGESECRELEISWTRELCFVLFVDKSFYQPIELFDINIFNQNRVPFTFRKGDIIGGKTTIPLKDNVQIYRNSAGYYQRFLSVLDEFKKTAGVELENADLSISEDVAQHDMISCASPGWSSAYDIPTDKITKNCVIDNSWLVYQLLQTRPAVIVIVGASTFQMFARVFSSYLKDFDHIEKDGKIEIIMKETYQFLRDTTEQEKFLRIKAGDYELQSRLIISPHFSYAVNFVEHSRLSLSAWSAFKADFPKDAQILTDNNRVTDASGNMVSIAIEESGDDIRHSLSAGAWKVLLAYYIKPVKMMASVLLQELKAGHIEYDPEINRLKRAEGGCRFCVNSLWHFPEACPYGKDRENEPAAGYFENIVKAERRTKLA